MCKFGNKKCVLHAVAFFVEFFRFSKFQHYRKVGIFKKKNLNRFRNDFWSYHTHYQALSECANSKS